MQSRGPLCILQTKKNCDDDDDSDGCVDKDENDAAAHERRTHA